LEPIIEKFIKLKPTLLTKWIFPDSCPFT
jgi:hypothetical protein